MLQQNHPKVEITVSVQARYVRIRATNKGIIPTSEYGAGGKAWRMLDEFRVD